MNYCTECGASTKDEGGTFFPNNLYVFLCDLHKDFRLCCLPNIMEMMGIQAPEDHLPENRPHTMTNMPDLEYDDDES